MPIAKLGRYRIHYRNGEEYHWLKQEIFTQDEYYFETKASSPIIVDAGAHIGLATLYFKKLYPAARITAIEPLPQNRELLQQNLWENRLDDVTVVPAALAAHAGQTTFYFDANKAEWFSTAGFSAGAWNGQQKSQPMKVETLPLSQFLTGPVDVLKLDIEGAEQAVLLEAKAQLKHVKLLLIEFHPVGHQSLSSVLELLADQGFIYALWKDGREVTIADATGLVLIEAINQAFSK